MLFLFLSIGALLFCSRWANNPKSFRYDVADGDGFAAAWSNGALGICLLSGLALSRTGKTDAGAVQRIFKSSCSRISTAGTFLIKNERKFLDITG